MEIYLYVIAILGAAVAGAINTMAGNGSAITLTILTELLGLPANMANGTNRVGVFTQTLATTYGFHRNGRLKMDRSKLYMISTVIGAVIGVIISTKVSNEQFKSVFRFLMIIMLFVILIKPQKWLRETDHSKQVNPWVVIPAYLGIGFYGGFIQMGMGVVFLAVTVLWAHFSLMDSNVMKSVIVGVYTLLALIIFQWNGLIDWKLGGVMAIGQSAGGYLMANFASKYPQANVWAHRILVVIVILAIVKLFNLHQYFF